MTEAQINELKKAKYAAYYNAEDWQGAAKEVKAANVRLTAQPVSRDTFIKWFSDEMVTLYSLEYAAAAPQAAAAFKALYESVIVPQDTVNVGSEKLRTLLVAMKAANLIVDNEKYGTADAQIESVCTEQWLPTAEEISKAIVGHPDLASIRASIWRPNGTRLDQPDHIAEQEVQRRAEALAELAAQEGNS